MEKELWFRQKTYGWGWTPCNLKGWIVILIFFIVIAAYPTLCKYGYCQFSPLVFLIDILASSAALTWICYLKGEKPEWRWGSK